MWVCGEGGRGWKLSAAFFSLLAIYIYCNLSQCRGKLNIQLSNVAEKSKNIDFQKDNFLRVHTIQLKICLHL